MLGETARKALLEMKQRLMKKEIEERPRKYKKPKPLSEENRAKRREMMKIAKQIWVDKCRKTREEKAEKAKQEEVLAIKTKKDSFDSNLDIREQLVKWMGI